MTEMTQYFSFARVVVIVWLLRNNGMVVSRVKEDLVAEWAALRIHFTELLDQVERADHVADIC